MGQCQPLGGTSIAKRWLPIGGVGEISYSIKLGAVDAVEDDESTTNDDESMDARPEILPGDRMGYRIDGGHSFVATVNDMTGDVEVEGTADRKSVLAMPVFFVAQDMFDDPTTDGTDYQMVERSLARTLVITPQAIDTQDDADPRYLPATAGQNTLCRQPVRSRVFRRRLSQSYGLGVRTPQVALRR